MRRQETSEEMGALVLVRDGAGWDQRVVEVVSSGQIPGLF